MTKGRRYRTAIGLWKVRRRKWHAPRHRRGTRPTKYRKNNLALERMLGLAAV